jgi:hypothetical protein
MGIVVQFKHALPKQSDKRSDLSSCEHLSAIAGQLLMIDAYRSAIDKNLRLVESIMRNTENPELRARLTDQMKCMHDQLLMALRGLLDAKRSVEESSLCV